MAKRIHKIYSAVLRGFLIIGLPLSSGCIYAHLDILGRQWGADENVCPTLLPNCAQVYAWSTVHRPGIQPEDYGFYGLACLLIAPPAPILDVALLPINLPVCIFSDWKYQPFKLTVTPNQTEASVTWSGISVPPGEGDAYIFNTQPMQTYLTPHMIDLTFHIEQGILTIPRQYPKATDSDLLFDKNTGRKRYRDQIFMTYDDSRQFKILFNLTSSQMGYSWKSYYFYDSNSKTYLEDSNPRIRYFDSSGNFVILISPDFKGEIAFEGKRYIVDKTKAENQLIVKED